MALKQSSSYAPCARTETGPSTLPSTWHKSTAAFTPLVTQVGSSRGLPERTLQRSHTQVELGFLAGHGLEWHRHLGRDRKARTPRNVHLAYHDRILGGELSLEVIWKTLVASSFDGGAISSPMRLPQRASTARSAGLTTFAAGGMPGLQPLRDHGRVVTHLGSDLVTLQPWRYGSRVSPATSMGPPLRHEHGTTSSRFVPGNTPALDARTPPGSTWRAVPPFTGMHSMAIPRLEGTPPPGVDALGGALADLLTNANSVDRRSRLPVIARRDD